MAKVKANSDATKGIFGKAIEALNPRKSMSKAKASVATDYIDMAEKNKSIAKEIVSGVYNDKTMKSHISEKDFNDIKKKTAKVQELMKNNKNFNETANKIMSEKSLGGAGMKDSAKIVGRGIKNYYNPNKATATEAALRYGTTALGAGAIGVAGRYLGGGTLTKDKEGRKDIAGVPFI